MNYNDSLTFTSNQDVPIYEDGKSISQARLYTDLEENNRKLNHGQYFFTVIDRNEKLGVRIWDTLNYARTEYTALDYYPIDTKMNIPASFRPYEKAKEIQLKNILGMEMHQEIDGVLEFTIDDVIGKDWFRKFLPEAEQKKVSKAFMESLQKNVYSHFRNKILL